MKKPVKIQRKNTNTVINIPKYIADHFEMKDKGIVYLEVVKDKIVISFKK